MRATYRDHKNFLVEIKPVFLREGNTFRNLLISRFLVAEDFEIITCPSSEFHKFFGMLNE